MSFRARVLLAFLAVVLIPMAVVGLGVHREIETRLGTQDEERIRSLTSVIEDDLDRTAREIGTRLSTLGRAMTSDNRLRAAIAGEGDRQYLLDYAGQAMPLTGLSVLQIQDDEGRILSSGHFRNAFDVVAPHLPRALSELPGTVALVQVPAAEGGFLALARADSVVLGGRTYHLVGGVRVSEEFLESLSPDPELSVRLDYPAGMLPAAPSGERGTAGGIGLPYLNAAGPGTDLEPARARFEIFHAGTTLEMLRRSMNLWFASVLAGAVVLALLLAAGLSSRVTRPLEALAAKTRRVDLERLDVDFRSERGDEVGQLSRLLGSMTERLRAGARKLRDAERRATLGEVARQVNHDIRNGLAPIRNVIRHLEEVAREAPGELPAIFDERRETLSSSVAYLETLAGHYQRLSRRADTGSADPTSVVKDVVEATSAGRDLRVSLEAPGSLPRVQAGSVTLRRIVENLVNNAADAVRQNGGSVRVRAEVVRDAQLKGEESSREPDRRSRAAAPMVRIVVEDTGHGMSEEERARALDDFYTTREGGTGLGLAVVRRLVSDLGGTLDLESEPGEGTRVTVILPTAATGGGRR